MQLVTAVIRPFKIDDVKDALKEVDCRGMTVTEVKGFGRQGGHTETYRGAEYTVEFVPKAKVEILSVPEETQKIVDVLTKASQTGKIGDGKIWVTTVDSVVRIRTGELDSEAV